MPLIVPPQRPKVEASIPERTVAPQHASLSGANSVLFLTVALCWGSTFLLVRIAAPHTSPLVVVELRLVSGAAVTWGIARLTSIRHSHSISVLRPWALRGIPLTLLMAVVPFALLTLGERGISSGTASVLNTTAPLWAMLVGFIAGVRAPGTSRSPARGRALGFALGTLGVAVLVGLHPNGGVVDALVVLTSTALYSSAGVYAQAAFAAAPPFAPPLLTTALGAIIALPLGLLGWSAHPPTSGAILVSCIAGALPNGVAYMAYFLLVRRLGATQTLSVTYLTPVVALMLGAVFLSERVTLTDIIGLTVILAGVAAVHGRLPFVGSVQRAVETQPSANRRPAEHQCP